MTLTADERLRLREEMLQVAAGAVHIAAPTQTYEGDGWRLDVTREPNGSVTANLQSDRMFLAENSGTLPSVKGVAAMLVNLVDSFIARYQR